MKKLALLLVAVTLFATHSVASYGVADVDGAFPSFGISPFPQLVPENCSSDATGYMVFGDPCQPEPSSLMLVLEALQ